MRSTPHPFAWILLAGLALGVAAAALAPARAPAVALYWNPIYRAEIALVVLALVYLLSVVGWMAWNGKAFQRIELLGGVALERDASELDAAAEDFDGFQASVNDRLDEVEAAIGNLNDRVDRIESGSTGRATRVP